MNTKLLPQIAALLLAAWPLPSVAAGHQDQTFLTRAVTVAGEQTARGIAHSIDSNLPVRWFAQRLMRDYARIDSSLRSFARADGVQLPERGPHSMPRTFFANDALWLQEVIAGQRAAIATFERAARTAHDTRVRALANSILPVLRRDLQKAETVSSGVMQRATVFSGRWKRLRTPLSDPRQARAGPSRLL